MRKARQLAPHWLRRTLKVRKEAGELRRVARLDFDPRQLRRSSEIDLTRLLAVHELEAEWASTMERLSQLGIPDGTGGVNPGDRRAIHHVIRRLAPESVLEVGTHIGASTVHIAAAMSLGTGGPEKTPARFVSVDVQDVNDPELRPWIRHGTTQSPLEMLQGLGLDSAVKFVNSPSLDYLASCERRFELVFLDGDHSARTVYREIPAALRVLNEGGVILLHDYFPDLRPLWSNGAMIPGPFLAIQRISEVEGVPLTVTPLGKLPWPTKLGSYVSSLALLLRRG